MKHLTQVLTRNRGIFFYLVLILISVFAILYVVHPSFEDVIEIASPVFTEEVLMFIIVGFIAQMIDGALGMAYGATSNTFLMGLGVPPAAASASIHMAEVFTTGASGLSHYRLGNVNKKLFLKLVIPGVIGAVIGAYIIGEVFDTKSGIKWIKLVVSSYLMVLAFIIIRKALQKPSPKKPTKNIGRLAFLGGFMDSVGGGGWGPIVTSTLLSKGRSPRYTIGSVSMTEFFVALSSSITFFFTIGFDHWQTIFGLIVGGVAAAPIAAYSVNYIRPKKLMLIVGGVIILLSIRTFYLTFHS